MIPASYVDDADTRAVPAKAPTPGLAYYANRYVIERKKRSEIATTTARSYRATLSLFAGFVGPERPVGSITRRHVHKWLEADVSIRTKRDRIQLLDQFFDWLIQEGRVKKNPCLGISKPKEPRRLPRGLTRPQVATALKEAPDERARLVILLMVQEGLRRIEVTRLQMGDIDTDERTMQVRGKGDHERLLPISDETWSAMQTYLAVYPARNGPLIRSYMHPTRGLAPLTVGNLVSQTLHRAGVNASGHQLRHTMAGDLLRSGANLRDIQTALGHVNLGTTQRYLPLTAGRDLREVMAGRSYRFADSAEDPGRFLRQSEGSATVPYLDPTIQAPEELR